MIKLTLRDYQNECINAIENHPTGSHICKLATGLGKTATFANLPRKGKVLILAHREELVNQPVKYFDCPVGKEMQKETSHGEEVVIASVQSLVNRLEKFSPTEFDTIITDECQHSAAKTYRKIYGYFKPRLMLGFTATPNRGDRVKLSDIYEDIIFDRDLKWGITHGYLSNIECLRANIGYSLKKVKTKRGDFEEKSLDEAINLDYINKAIGEAYQKYAQGQTLIFAASVSHAYNIAAEIPGAVVVTAKTKNRQEIIDKFTRKEIPVLINCMIFTEGTDIPLIETIIIARPTKNASLYTQMVGRGLRLYEGKTKLTLIDCVGDSDTLDLCTAPTLLGIDMKSVPQYRTPEIEGDLLSLENKILTASDNPESWIKNMSVVNLWMKDNQYDSHNVNWFKMPNGDFVCMLPNNEELTLPCPDEVGETIYNGKKMPMQKGFDEAYHYLNTFKTYCESIWNLKKAKAWANDNITEKQAALIKKFDSSINTTALNKFEASQVLNRLMSKTPICADTKATVSTNQQQINDKTNLTQQPETVQPEKSSFPYSIMHNLHEPPTEKQLQVIVQFIPDYIISCLNKYNSSVIIRMVLDSSHSNHGIVSQSVLDKILDYSHEITAEQKEQILHYCPEFDFSLTHLHKLESDEIIKYFEHLGTISKQLSQQSSNNTKLLTGEQIHF